jgi:hypothetical protein
MIWKLLEPVTTLALIAVSAALGWIIAATIAPAAVRWTSEETEVVVILVLLTAAICLVSALALGNSRSRDLP